MLAIVNSFSRFSPPLRLRFSLCGSDAEEILERVGNDGFPLATSRFDHGSELVSRALDCGLTSAGSHWACGLESRSDNAFIEAFNGRPRAERLNADRLLRPTDAE